MRMTFRWFGQDNDPISIGKIKQIPGMTGVMACLDHKAAGEIWSMEEIADFIRPVKEAGLACDVIESVNVHEDIKLGAQTRDQYIENYIATIRNLAKHGIRVIVYNFMPVFDWMRTDLARVIPEDGSNSLYYDEKDIASGYDEVVRRIGEGTAKFSLPGWEPERLAELGDTIRRYEGVSQDDIRAHYKYFLNAIMPACEETGITMACHPDDPAWPIFGLPRIAHSLAGYNKIVDLHPSKRHAVCLCTGSLGSNPDNDIPAMVYELGGKGRIACMHIRNVKHLGYRCFRESSHLSSDGDLDMHAIVKAVYETCPDVYVRPDHGRMIWGETGRAGYGLYDRALGVAYLNGLWEAIDKSTR